MTWINAPHNPEVAGSNPAPATQGGPAKRGFFSVGTSPRFAKELVKCARLCSLPLETHRVELRERLGDARRFASDEPEGAQCERPRVAVAFEEGSRLLLYARTLTENGESVEACGGGVETPWIDTRGDVPEESGGFIQVAPEQREPEEGGLPLRRARHHRPLEYSFLEHPRLRLLAKVDEAERANDERAPVELARRLRVRLGSCLRARC